MLGLYDQAIVAPRHRGTSPLGACLLEDDGAALDAGLEAFLTAGPPPVYIGFGSMPAGDPDARTSLVVGALEESGLRAVLDQGWGGLGNGASGDNVHWVTGVNHRRLLPRMAVIVHHGGAGTTAMAARVGLPQVIVPHITDQFYFGKRIAELGAGPKPLPAKRLTRARLVGRLHTAVNDAGIRARAGSLARELQGADGPRAAARALDTYASR